jgi:moderate conductance mechanosensitive channel
VASHRRAASYAATCAIFTAAVARSVSTLLQYFTGRAAVVMFGRLILVMVLGTMDRVFRINPELQRRFPGLEVRGGRYLPLLRRAYPA